MRSKRLARAGFAVPAVLAVLLTLGSCGPDGQGPPASITIGTTTSEVNALILVAQDRGYFADNGLEVSHRIYPSGVAAIDGLFNQEVDLATGSEFAFAGRVLAQQPIRTIAAINTSSLEYVVGRVDRGINTIADLRGKTIGVPLKSRPEFALDRFLYFRGIAPSEVTLVHVPVDESVGALVTGTVDAVAAWQPYIDQISERMGDQVVAWSVQEDQPSYTLVMCQAGWTAENRELVTRFLTSLIEAESYVSGNPEAARVFLQQKLGYSEDYVADVWPDNRYSVLLDQALVVAMEDQARWLMDKKLTPATEIPNFVSYIYLDGLEAVKPEAVNIIR